MIAEELSKTYEPRTVEPKWYEHWLERGCFKADPNSAKPGYSIVIPPPNVTGILTLGHVLNNTIQDILARRARMLGKEVLWLPGTDHAGIATQNVVEKSLRKEGLMKHRDDLGREALVAKIWEWKETYGGIILQQLRALGASCDWSRTRFTMDEDYSACVSRVFVELYKKGLIYRGKRMVNWCPASLTALSDEEVEMRDQNSLLYHFKVEVNDGSGTFLEIATTRPETIPGDTAIAVHPEDPRYKHLIGKTAKRPLPLEDQASIPIVGDTHIDIEFGTGVLKVTPAHDKADFEIGQRHGLQIVDVIEPNGKMSVAAGLDLAGLDRFEARKKAAALLEEHGFLVRAEPYANKVGFSERGQVPVEPRLSEQWFLRYPCVDDAKSAVADGSLRFYPDRWAKVYDHWMENLQDWCISRQLWWGHRIPVWYHLQSGEVHCDLTPPADPENWRQDPDVLDTWFSSWLWPFATMGWPEQTPELKKFYPTTDLVTGPDIIFFWVARMIMAGYEYAGEMPFRNVYYTGIIRDKQGRKMSKSLGNSPDPLELIEKYGADALRFGVMRSAPLGADVVYDEKNVELGRNFCTKLWNAARFRQMQGGESEGEIDKERLGIEDKWLLLRLDEAIRQVTLALEEYRFSDATQALYRFFWNEYCDWYLEAAKASLNGTDEKRKANTLAVMDFVMGHALRLFHPFMPFITEELWHGMGYSKDLPTQQGAETILYAHWPAALDEAFKAFYGLDEASDAEAKATFEVVNAARGLRRDFNLPSNRKLAFVLQTESLPSAEKITMLETLMAALSLELNPAEKLPQGTPATLTPLGTLYLPLEGVVDKAAEVARLGKEIEKVEKDLDSTVQRLGSDAFVANAPAEVIEEMRQRKADKIATLERLRVLRAGLEA